MANHVHVFLKPRYCPGLLARITQGMKGYTARLGSTRTLGCGGCTFWQDESYDHWARDEDELIRITEYIERNPVAAGLCCEPGSLARGPRHASASSWPYGEPFVRRSGFPA